MKRKCASIGQISITQTLSNANYILEVHIYNVMYFVYMRLMFNLKHDHIALEVVHIICTQIQNNNRKLAQCKVHCNYDKIMDNKLLRMI